ncbi:hypothetical protein PMAYCL1PPCAC_31126, partial [Pristionchus mayeri]
MAISRMVSRKHEKRLSRAQDLVRSPSGNSVAIDVPKNVAEDPTAGEEKGLEETAPAKRTLFEEFGGAHGLICVGQMLINAHLLTIVLTRQLHCAPNQDVYYLLIGIFGCVGGFCLGDKSDKMEFGAMGRWAMRIQLLLIAVCSFDCADRTC